ncbi:hypothetical protein BACCIP111895_02209 [Neobacillus rhizosphaerae]|uniref:Transposase n=1 Tax=Neobacillus rhizosphaerae TaxID=2880965 RepID=A0ABM9EQW5_9BACI|nr:hypothetical protein BACCIP111895_02209 [Neobacillus rhizosphaerae]
MKLMVSQAIEKPSTVFIFCGKGAERRKNESL